METPARRRLVRGVGAFAGCVVLVVFVVLASCSGVGEPASESDSASAHRGSATAASQIQRSALHLLHAGAKPGIRCEACHEVVDREYLRAKSWQCLECHQGTPLALHAAAAIDSPARECWSCHDFTSADKRPTACATCHAKAQGTVHAIGPHDPQHPDEDCGTCHRAHKQPTLVTTRCETCHHEPVTGHDKPNVPITGCASCHGFHEPAAVASDRCMNCHRQSHQRVPTTALFPAGHVKCVTCHRQHRFVKTEVLACRGECHAKQVAIAETKVKEHRCLGCHDNHDVHASAPRSCEREACHGGKIRPAHPVDPVSKTRCLGCHKPHAGPGAPLAVACSSCHRAAASDRAFHQGAHGKGPECRSCHKPHDFDLAAAGLKLCLGCHGEQPFPNAKTIRTYDKHSNCLGCHGDTVRHQPAGPRAACTTCHTEKTAQVRKGHAKCIGCHDPHTTKQQNPCGTCHAQEASIARKDHKTCTNCHEPHGGAQKRACGSCHAAEAATAPAAHQQCTNCHDQHSTLVKKPCGACHADRTTGVHAPVKGGCINCHRPHGPNGVASPPPCTTCHTKPLPLLHQIPNHKTCTSCHRSHGEQPHRLRATCIACHKDREHHEPTAAACTGCHNFGGEP